MSNNVFIDLTEELHNKGWTTYWEFNTNPLLKYNHCVTYLDCREIEPNVANDVDGNGAWNYRLDNLETGGGYNMESYTLEGLFMIDELTPNTSLESFNVDLPNLTNGTAMFAGCLGLTSFISDLPNLINGYGMFASCSNLTSFISDLPNLTNGERMFYYCSNLTSFSGELSSLTNGYMMFHNCTGLTSFTSDLSSLTIGYGMFGRTSNCTKLDLASVQHIAKTINDLTGKPSDGYAGWGRIDIGIGNTTPSTEEETAFNTMVSKGWTVFVNGSGTNWTPTASTNLTDEEQSTSISFYAKYIQVTDEDSAGYVDANNNYYNIIGAQFIYGDDLSTYGAFTSFEHAESEIMLDLNLTKIEKTNLSNFLIKR